MLKRVDIWGTFAPNANFFFYWDINLHKSNTNLLFAWALCQLTNHSPLTPNHVIYDIFMAIYVQKIAKIYFKTRDARMALAAGSGTCSTGWCVGVTRKMYFPVDSHTPSLSTATRRRALSRQSTLFLNE